MPDVVTPHPARDRAYAAMLKARLNVIYFEKLGGRFEWWDRSLRIGSLILSSGGVVSLLAWANMPALPIALGALSAIMSAVQLVGSFAERARGVAAIALRAAEATLRARR